MRIAKIIYIISRGLAILILGLGLSMDGSGHGGSFYTLAAVSVCIGIISCLLTLIKNKDLTKPFFWIKFLIFIIDLIALNILIVHYQIAKDIYLWALIFIFLPSSILFVDNIGFAFRNKFVAKINNIRK